MMNKDVLIGFTGAIVLHGMVLFVTVPMTKAHYEVIVAPTAIEVSLVKTPRKVEKPPEPPQEPLPPPPEPVKEPEIFREPEPVPEPEPEPEPEKVLEEPVDEIEEVEEKPEPESVKQGATSDVQPLTQFNKPPNYPRVAKRRGWEGRVVLSVLVSKEGLVKNIDILTSSGYTILDTEAVESVRKWRFEPAVLFGNPIEQRIEIPIRFRLDDA